MVSTPGRGRRRLFALLALLLPFLAVLALEGGLRLAGFGESYPLFIPVPEAPDYLRVNPKVVTRFMVGGEEAPNLWIRPVYFERRKSPDTLRIFVQGGSTAEGYPYGYGASPAGMLQQRLQRTFPERRVEVVTTAMSAVTSYTLLDFSGEILEQSPDAVLIYAGHNEYVGILGVGSGVSGGRLRPLVLSSLWLDESRIFQLARRGLQALGPDPERRDPERTLMATIVAEKQIPYGSGLFRRGLAQYRANLRALLRRYREAGVPVFVGTVVSNLRDQPPFAGDDAREHYSRARSLDANGRYEEARAAYAAARDRDQLRFRAPGEINTILREVAAREGARVVEVEETFTRAARDGIVGYDLILEHLHPNLEGYFLMADAFYEALRERRLFASWDRAVGREEARDAMPITEVDRLYGEYRVRRLTSDWPFADPPQPFRLPSATRRIEEIAQSYYRGHYEWPGAMRALLHHYRRQDRRIEAARTAVLLAEAFPNRPEDQRVAAALLAAAGLDDAEIYRRRAASTAENRKAVPIQKSGSTSASRL